MAKKTKTKSAEKKKQQPQQQQRKAPRLSMEALEAMSDSDEGGSLPPESEWNADAKALKAAIESGMLEKALEMAHDDDGDEFEEATLGDEDDDGDDDSVASAVENKETELENGQADDDDCSNDDDDDDDDKSNSDEDNEEVGNTDKIIVDSESNEEIADDDASDQDEDDAEQAPAKKLKREDNAEEAAAKSKALQVVTAALVGEKRNWPWAETFHIMPSTALPFDGKKGDDDDEAANIHDDLKREVAFYENALAAVLEAKERCTKDNVPFSRPDDFFAEMVKTDEHMAKVKDRLIFETKKMDAVAQRKSNKEQKLRAKESHANKLAEKSKRKKDHFKAVDDWAESAAQNRGGRLNDKDDVDSYFHKSGGGSAPGNKRKWADKKFGHGGKSGRFKQNDPKALNDMSGFNRNGNFGGMGTKKAGRGGSGSSKGASGSSKGGSGSGPSRKGKRARDAKRSR